jgi:hypothetical protein
VRNIGVTFMTIAAAGSWGCSSPLPAYPWKDHETAQRLMAEHAAKVQSVQSGARVILTAADGNSVTLDAAIVAVPPNRFRLRAWKLGHAVMDLTLTPEGVWLKAEENRGEGTGGAAAGLRSIGAGGIAGPWTLFTGGLLDQGGVRGNGRIEMTDDGGPTFTLRRLADKVGAASIICEVDRRTLTARRCAVLDELGVERAVLTLGDYRDFGGIVFPTRLDATGADGTVVVLLDDPEFNTPLPPDAFVPPAGAIRHE